MAVTSWTVNFQSNDVSSATDLKATEVGKRHWVRTVCVTCLSGATNWFKIMDGTTEIVGPVIPGNGIPWFYKFSRPKSCTLGNAVRIKTQAALNISAIVEGFTTDE